MKTILTTILIFIVNITFAQTHDHHSGHDKKNAKKIEVKNQFIPTADLKMRMEKILNLMKELNPKKDDVKTVKSYGDKLTETVNDIFKTCKLEPDADAAIHPSLGLILDGASEFKNGKFESGHKKIHDALLDYEKMFKHEGWKH
jgi:hypothetical protein